MVEDPNVPLGMSVSGALNALFGGRTGSGKTTAMRVTGRDVLRWNEEHPDRWITLIILDRKGGDYADLPQVAGQTWLHLGAHETLHLGLQQPAGVPPRVAINRASEIIAARANLKFSATVLANMMELLLWALNPQAQEPLLWPTLANILELARIAPLHLLAEKSDYERSLVQRLEGLVQSSGTMFQAHRGLELERLVAERKHAVLDLCALSPAWVRAIATDLLFNQLLLGRQYRYQRCDAIDCVIIADEMDQDISEEWEAAFEDNLSPTAQLVKQGREAGIGICLGVSAVGPVAQMILTSINHHFFFGKKRPLYRIPADALDDFLNRRYETGPQQQRPPRFKRLATVEDYFPHLR